MVFFEKHFKMYTRMCMWNFQQKQNVPFKNMLKKQLIVQLKSYKERFHRGSYLWHTWFFFAFCNVRAGRKDHRRVHICPQIQWHKNTLPAGRTSRSAQKCIPVTDQEAYYLQLHTNNICSVHDHELEAQQSIFTVK